MAAAFTGAKKAIAIADEGRCVMSFDVITKEHRPHPKLLAVVHKQ
jgi:hypothetical protein